jgi:hypothetical protein
MLPPDTAGSSFCFAAEPCQSLRILPDGIGQHFDGHLPVQLGIVGEVHFAHATFSQGADDFIIGYLCTGHSKGLSVDYWAASLVFIIEQDYVFLYSQVTVILLTG